MRMKLRNNLKKMRKNRLKFLNKFRGLKRNCGWGCGTISDEGVSMEDSDDSEESMDDESEADEDLNPIIEESDPMKVLRKRCDGNVSCLLYTSPSPRDRG